MPPYFVVILCVILLAGVLFFFTGCSPKLTNANLDKVQTGMHGAQVEAILGKPTRIESSDTLGLKGAAWYYQKDGADVQIVFLNDGVMLKQGTFK